MARQFSLVYLTTPNCSPPQMIHLAADAGFEFVSLRTIAMGLRNEPNFGLASNKELLIQTRNALADTGVKIHDTENARIYDGVDLKSYIPELEVAAELGARCILTNIWTPDRVFVADALAELCDLAKPLGLQVIVEFVTWAQITTLNDVVALVCESNRDNVGIVLDTLHFHRSRCSLDDLDLVPPGMLKFVHLCDAPKEIPSTIDGLIHAGRAERLYPGEGGIDIASIVSRLPPMVYGIEIPHLERAKAIGDANHAAVCLQRTKAYLNAHRV